MRDYWIGPEYDNDNSSDESSEEEVSEGEYLNKINDLYLLVSEECKRAGIPVRDKLSVGTSFMKMFRQVGM